MENKSSFLILTLLNLKGIGSAFIWKNLSQIKNGVESIVGVGDILEKCQKNIFPPEDIVVAEDMAYKTLQLCKESNIEIVNVFDSDFPNRFFSSSTKYPILYLKGNWKNKNKNIGIIGSRKASGIASEIANRIGQFVSNNDCSIVTGIAEGIDFAGTKSELAASNCIGVVPAGLAFEKFNILNKEYYKEANRILESGGCLASSFSPWIAQDQFKTVEYCKLQAALSDTLVLVQSDLDGGSKFTVDAFARTDRKLCIVNISKYDLNQLYYTVNDLIINKKNEGVSEWCGLKKDKILCNIEIIESKSDYQKIISIKSNTTGSQLF